MRIVYRAVILTGAVFLMLFAVSNREMVSVALWPLPFVVGLPLYLLSFLSLLIGAFLAVAAGWLGGRHNRRELRRRRRRIEALERELSATQARLADRRDVSQPALPGAPL